MKLPHSCIEIYDRRKTDTTRLRAIPPRREVSPRAHPHHQCLAGEENPRAAPAGDEAGGQGISTTSGCTGSPPRLRTGASSKPFGLAYEETLVWGLTINALKCTPAERLDLLRSYVPVLDNWAVCDSFCCNAKWALKLPPQDLWAFLIPYYHSHREFEVRFAIVMSMCYLLK